MKRFASASILALTCAAFAQSDSLPQDAFTNPWGAEHALNRNTGYSGRANELVYSTGLPEETGGAFAGPVGGAAALLGDDLNWTPGPGAAGGFSVNGIAFGGWVAAGNTVDVADFRFTFYTTYAPAGSPVNQGAVIGEIIVTVGSLIATSGQGFFFAEPVALPSPMPVPAGTGPIFVTADVVNDASLPTPTRLANVCCLTRTNHVWWVGSSDGYRYFTGPGDFVINPVDRTPVTPPVIPTNNRSIYLKLQADIGAPTCDGDFNCDGSADQGDIASMINVLSFPGNPGDECQDPDFNFDGNVDQDDVAALINVVAGGTCP